MIRSFRDRESRRIARGEYSSRFPVSTQKRARLCIERIHSVHHPADLSSFPSMRFKKLSGKHQEIYSVRVNDQYRVCFGWVDGFAVNVELVDYH
jgi:proteic killer suppression protein